MAREASFAVGHRVRVYPGSSDERLGVIVDDFGDSAGSAVIVGTTRIAGPSRRWAITLDEGGLVFADTADIANAHNTI
jgi:hypothetical protein